MNLATTEIDVRKHERDEALVRVQAAESQLDQATKEIEDRKRERDEALVRVQAAESLQKKESAVMATTMHRATDQISDV